jgi:hypothetical protein
MVRASKVVAIAIIATTIFGVVAILLFIGYAKLNDQSPNPLTYLSCNTETREEIRNLAEGDFSVEYSNCDTLAKDEAIRVYASRPIAGGLLTKRTVLFWYDPWNYDEPLPSITEPQTGHILIAVPRVSSIAMQKKEWNGYQIDYKVGYVEYP